MESTRGAALAVPPPHLSLYSFERHLPRLQNPPRPLEIMGDILDPRTLLQSAGDHSWAIAVLLLVAIVTIGIFLGDGAPAYNQYAFVGQGLLMPWLNWSTADRWRLHELGPVAYEKVSISASALIQNFLTFTVH